MRPPRFTPPPPNDFEEFSQTYFERCRQRVPKIGVVTAKWRFEDLIPGLSDFDTRFILSDGMTVSDWEAMSLAVGEVHTQMALENPDWARNLEHLPGLNLTVSEMTDPAQYYPEFSQWTFYGGDADITARVEAALATREWSTRDEIYHLKRVALFFGSYVRGIDPAVNLGAWESKYPLHSRFMHYFTPPVQAMASLALQRNIAGKLEALRLARDLFPDPGLIDLIFEALDLHYEMPPLYLDPRLAALEVRMADYLSAAWTTVGPHITLIAPSADDTRETIGRRLAAVPADPVEEFFSRAKFARLMKGRLLFYAREIPSFDSVWLIKNELGRIVDNFFHQPLIAFGQACLGENLSGHEVLAHLEGNLLTRGEAEGMRRFERVARQPPGSGQEKMQARAVADAYDPVLHVLEKIREQITTQPPSTLKEPGLQSIVKNRSLGAVH